MSTSDFKKQFSQQFSLIDVPPPLDHLTPDALAELVAKQRAGSEGLSVFDVRTSDEFSKGHIAGSVHVPLEEFIESVGRLVKAVKETVAKGVTPRVVVVSLQSPDIDDAAALAFVQAWAEEKEKDPSLPDANGFVHILLGGVFHWLQLHGTDAGLTSAFDVEYWAPFFRGPRAEESA